MSRRLVAALLALALFLAYVTATTDADDGALCDTDTDCARFCPPPADDPSCDGGPQS